MKQTLITTLSHFAARVFQTEQPIRTSSDRMWIDYLHTKPTCIPRGQARTPMYNPCMNKMHIYKQIIPKTQRTSSNHQYSHTAIRFGTFVLNQTCLGVAA